MNVPENSCCDLDRQGEQPNAQRCFDILGWQKKGLHSFHALSLNCKFIDSNCEQLGFRVLVKAGKMIERDFSVSHR